MLFTSNSTIQCKRERIREDGRYVHRERERTHTRIAINGRKNMAAITFIFSEIPTSSHI